MYSYIEKELEKLYYDISEVLFGSSLPCVNFKIIETEKYMKNWFFKTEDRSYEIIVNYDSLFDDSETIIISMLHQMVHIYCSDLGICDTSRSGRYHNKKFKKYGELYGLEFEFQASVGFVTIGMTDETRIKLKKVIEILRRSMNQAISNDMREEQIRLRSKMDKKQGMIIYQCPICKQIAKTASKTKLICGKCYVEMLPN